uniref:Putative secreted protein n=1 Tax=Rhipicephalus microplus TaxID=6941 RepID=A0A6M2D9P3_RHIMP
MFCFFFFFFSTVDLAANGLPSLFLASSPKQNSILHCCRGPKSYPVAAECSLVSLTVNTRYISQCTERLMSLEEAAGKHTYGCTRIVLTLFVENYAIARGIASLV